MFWGAKIRAGGLFLQEGVGGGSGNVPFIYEDGSEIDKWVSES